MATMIATSVMAQLGLGELQLLAQLPTISENFWKGIIDWLVKIAASFAIIYLAADLVRNLFSSDRDFKRAGMDISATLILLLLVSKAPEVISTLVGWMGITNSGLPGVTP